ncbi:MAG: recombination protein NinB [Clostridia bacterium]|nr:recombination protein NinB [Clostridia bacterium]
MSKIIATSLYKMTNENNQIVMCFVIANDNRYSAESAFKELKSLPEKSKIQITASQYKSKRSLEQNRMLWALVEKITIAQSGYSRKEDLESCYCALIEEANIEGTIKYEPALPSSRGMLENEYRVVKEVGKRIILDPETKKQTPCCIYKCYRGSSTFNTKQMTELIDLALDTLSMLGVADSEILAIREEYRY